MNYLMVMLISCSIVSASDFLPKIPIARPVIPPIVIPSLQDSIDSSLLSDEDLLCNAALSVINNHRKTNMPDIKKIVIEVILEDKNSPLTNPALVNESLNYLRETFPSRVMSPGRLAYINDIVVKSCQKALEEQKVQLDALAQQLECKISKRLSAAICTISTTCVTLFVSLLVHYQNKNA